ncbi:hypothetical protein CC2G_000225 [Coprinopsis cinerea AmutBmut pab1-1]|nr:hypothetical protein CC2G_000225 [Coprinopsis cinerea AmutBmut pab1-1]
MFIRRTPETEEEATTLAAVVDEYAKKEKLEVIQCLLYTVSGSEAVMVPVLVDRGCENNAAPVDLNPECYLHKKGCEGRQVTVVERTAFRCRRYDSFGLPMNDVYIVFHSRSDENVGKEKPNQTLDRVAKCSLNVWGNILVCRVNRRSGRVMSMGESDKKLVNWAVVTEVQLGLE